MEVATLEHREMTLQRTQSTRQDGMAVLTVVLIMLFGVSIAVLYLNRHVIYEQRISANQMRSTIAQEMAEAGLEWATGMLNDPRLIGTDCKPSTTSSNSFQRKYFHQLPTTPASSYVASHVLAGCKVNPDDGTSTCNCPDAPTSGTVIASLGSNAMPGFTVQFSPVTGDPEAVRVVATGCSAMAKTCQPGTSGEADASASITALLKFVPTLRAAPAAPLNCGLGCNISGSFNIQNQDSASGGLLINAGSSVSVSASALQTLPGLPPQRAIADNDTSLYSLAHDDPSCINSSIFSAYFGSSVSDYVDSPLTKSITCITATDCGAQLGAAYLAGWRAFYFPADLEINNSAPFTQLGAPNDGISLVSAGRIDINGNITIYGLLFMNNSNVNYLGTGTANVYGAAITCGGFSSNGNGTLGYMPSALSSLRMSSSVLARVPSSWTDRCSLGLPLPDAANTAASVICN